MNNKKRIIVFLIVALLYQLILGGYASAGIISWVSEKASGSSLIINNEWSFDKIYNSIIGQGDKDIDEYRLQTIQNNSVLAVANPSAVKNYVIDRQPKRILVSASGYSSTPDQTDATPFITASGTYVRDGVIAANFLPFGTAIKIPEVYGNKIFIVEDRMNKRYWYNIDIWFPDRQLAKEFGRRTVTIEIVS